MNCFSHPGHFFSHELKNCILHLSAHSINKSWCRRFRESKMYSYLCTHTLCTRVVLPSWAPDLLWHISIYCPQTADLRYLITTAKLRPFESLRLPETATMNAHFDWRAWILISLPTFCADYQKTSAATSPPNIFEPIKFTLYYGFTFWRWCAYVCTSDLCIAPVHLLLARSDGACSPLR